MKFKWFIAILLVVYIALLGFGIYLGVKQEGPAMAKIRYFDGSIDTLTVTAYRVEGGTAYLTTDRGWKIAASLNNVIIIEGDDDSE